MTCGPAERAISAVAGTTHTASAGTRPNFTWAYIPGNNARSSFGRRTSVSRVRDVGSRAPAVLAIFPTNARLGNSATSTCACCPGAIERTKVWGTLTKTRRSSTWASRNIHVAPLPLPDVIRAPRSMPRAVMIPAKGASTRWKDWSATSRCTLASLAATLARAALELAEAVGGAPGEALVRLRLLEPGARLVQVRLRLREARAGLRETRARLGEGGACLAQLLVELRRVDLGEHLAGRDAVADVDDALADVAVGAGVDRGLLDRLDVARQHEVDRPVRPPRRRHAHLHDPGVGRRGRGDELGVLAQTRQHADAEQDHEEHRPDEKTPGRS